MATAASTLSEPGRWAAVVRWLDEQACDRLVELCDAIESDVPRVVGQEQLGAHRVGRVHRIERSSDTEPVYELLWELGDTINRHHFGLDLSGIVKAPEYVEYLEDRGHFHWHNDYGLERPTSRRKLTVTLQLSDSAAYDGGALEVFGSVEPLPRERGTFIAFPAYVQHRVTAVTRGTRRVLVGWLAGPPLR